MTERAEFAASIDLRQIDTALDQTRARTANLGGGLTLLQGGLDRVDKAASRSVQQGLGSLQFALGGTAGQASQVVNAVGDVAGALATGGAFGLALAAGVVVVSKLASAYAEAEANSRIFGEATRATAEALRVAGDVQLKGYINRIDELKKSLRDFGLSSGELLTRDISNQLAGDKSALANLTPRLDQQRARTDLAEKQAAALRGEAFQADAELQRGILDQLEIRSDTLKKSIEQLGPKELETKLAAFTARSLQEIDANSKKASAKKLDPLEDGGYGGSVLADAMKPIEAAEAFRLEQLETSRQAKADITAMTVRSEVDAYLVTTNAAKEADKLKAELTYADLERQQEAQDKIRQGYQDVYGAGLSATLSGATGALQGFITDVATGQENAAERAAAAFLTSTGNQLVGIGTKAVIEGAIISANPLTPGLGLPMMGLGAAAIGVGIGMGAGGAAISASIASPASAGSGSSAARDPGVNRGSGGRGGGSSEGDGFVVNVTFAGAGPAPEQVGESINSALDAFYRRTGRGTPARLGPQIRR